MSRPRRLALTPGEPGGIGPDLSVRLAQTPRVHEIVAIADPALLEARAATLGLPLAVRPYEAERPPAGDAPGTLCVAPEPLRAPASPGALDPANAAYVLATLDRAIDGCLDGRFAAMVTAPIHKGVINDAGIPFTGHTEHLAERTGAEPVMMLVAGTLRVALATTHLPLAKVSEALSDSVLERALVVLHRDLVARFDLPSPRILVCGLNPHAGEGGHLGREEIDVIEPVLARLRTRGMDLVGPLPADTLFTPQHLAHADAVLAMFHDQGLPVLKYAGFGQGVNVTLGLPICRTSVDHGTALDRAGTGDIDGGSLAAALALAERMTDGTGAPNGTDAA